jgi:hypothetical protein
LLQATQVNSNKILNIVSKILGSLFALFYLFIVYLYFFGTNPEPPLPPDRAWEGVLMAVVGVTFFVGYLITWLKPKIGGIIIILSGLIILGPLFSYGNIGVFIFALPLWVCGILYILSNKKQPRTNFSN